MTPSPPSNEAEAVRLYRPFVVKTAARFRLHPDLSQEDLVQEGLLAVALAFRTYRADAGANFLTWIHRPVYYAMLKLARRDRRAGMSFRGARSLPQGGLGPAVGKASLDEPLSDDPEEDAGTLHDVLQAPEPEEISPQAAHLPDALKALTPRQSLVVRLRFERGLTLKEIGKRMGGLSGETIRLIEVDALRRLRARLEKP